MLVPHSKRRNVRLVRDSTQEDHPEGRKGLGSPNVSSLGHLFLLFFCCQVIKSSFAEPQYLGENWGDYCIEY